MKSSKSQFFFWFAKEAKYETLMIGFRTQELLEFTYYSSEVGIYKRKQENTLSTKKNFLSFLLTFLFSFINSQLRCGSISITYHFPNSFPPYFTYDVGHSYSMVLSVSELDVEVVPLSKILIKLTSYDNITHPFSRKYIIKDTNKYS